MPMWTSDWDRSSQGMGDWMRQFFPILFFFLYLREGETERKRVAPSNLTTSVLRDGAQPLSDIPGSPVWSMF